MICVSIIAVAPQTQSASRLFAGILTERENLNLGICGHVPRGTLFFSTFFPHRSQLFLSTKLGKRQGFQALLLLSPRFRRPGVFWWNGMNKVLDRPAVPFCPLGRNPRKPWRWADDLG